MTTTNANIEDSSAGVDGFPSTFDTRTERLLYTPLEAARVLGIGRSTLYTLMSRGSIRSVRVGSLRRIPIGELHAFVATLSNDWPESGPPSGLGVDDT